MKVFVSHSMKDEALLDGIQNEVGSGGIELFIAEHKVDMQNSITEKIKLMIEDCDVSLILLTESGLTSGFVREEIGYLEAKKKPSLIIFEKGVNEKYGGFKYGHDYVELNPNEPSKTLEQVKEILLRHWYRLQNRQLQLVQQEKRQQAYEDEQRKRMQNSAILGIGLIATILVLASSD